MTNLERILDKDSSGAELKKIKETLFQAQTAVKKELDRGCAPHQYQILIKRHEAYLAAQAVIENYVSQHS